MAAEFSTAPVAPQQIQHQPYHAYKHSFNTPLHSGRQTPANISPTSPRTVSNVPALHIQPPQVQPRKTPIYVPAALRKTEKPVRQSPPKVDSALSSAESSWNSAGGGFQQPAQDNNSAGSRIFSEELNGEAQLSPITGPVTRVHWKDDASTNVCTAAGCQTPFTFFNRRHHCRKCGGIFCNNHSLKQVKLNEHALFHPEGEFQRACDSCYENYRKWQHLRSSRANSESSAGSAAVNIDTPAPKRPEAQRVGSLAQSLQYGWSTF
ncbi:FYVE-domain-containing protein [Delitschia confertaspora ATCC 74209]|uniref:FYVE-domain-containing protein n=1 Tax=Delitschia confertaspora ATCC 74209 TaxID=1513339 RepID=A0A9P4JIR8_9PLEO|nr:FYVE-domain-containing protein [Delitschia confertaspora ATCC 74209]